MYIFYYMGSFNLMFLQNFSINKTFHYAMILSHNDFSPKKKSTILGNLTFSTTIVEILRFNLKLFSYPGSQSQWLEICSFMFSVCSPNETYQTELSTTLGNITQHTSSRLERHSFFRTSMPSFRNKETSYINRLQRLLCLIG